MKIGFTKQCITPNYPVSLSGFAAERIANSKIDDLFIKVVIYQTDEDIYGVLAYDLVAIDDLIIESVKTEIDKMNLNKNNFIFAATHTHSGPGGIVDTEKGILKPSQDIFIKTNPEIINDIIKKSVLAVKIALDDCLPASLSYTKNSIENVGNNRNSINFKGNNDIVAVFIEQENGRKAMIINYACHPTVMNGSNIKVSADFPGAIESCMQEHGFEMSLYLNGSCGDISTRFSRKSCDRSEILRYAKLFEDKLLDMYEKAEKININEFKVINKELTMLLKKADTLENSKKELENCQKRLEEAKSKGISGSELRVIESYKEGAEAKLRLAMNPYEMESFNTNLSFVKVNDHVFVCVPGELFSELSNPIQSNQVNFIGYANGYLGYFADTHAFDHYYYEALSSPFEKGQSEMMMEFINTEVNALLRKED